MGGSAMVVYVCTTRKHGIVALPNTLERCSNDRLTDERVEQLLNAYQSS
jgi:hypothetical protein